jgi:8-oxo-dGTP pyrophosphatase MutT (NUDIX family)
MHKVISLIEHALMKELPGINAHDALMPEGRLSFHNKSDKTDASVLLLIYPDTNNHGSIVFIKRAVYDGHHSGQISFPGGKQEPIDSTLAITALRESHEEIGITPKDIRIIGQLTNLYIPVSNFLVHPFIGYMTQSPNFIIDKKEVDYIIEFPLKDLLNLEIKQMQKEFLDKTRIIPYFSVKNEIIWGATSMILNEFIQIIKQ